MAGQLENWK